MKRRVTFPGLLLACLSSLPGCGDQKVARERTDWTSFELAGGAGGDDGLGGAPGSGATGATGATGPGQGGDGGSDPECSTDAATDPTVYEGTPQSGSCLDAGDPPIDGSWYLVEDDGGGTVIGSELGGADGTDDCALRSVTTGAEAYGGATLFLSDVAACAYDASEFVGLRMKLKGSSDMQDACGRESVVHVKISTLSTAPVEVGGNCVQPSDPNEPGCFDDFGGYCTLREDFTTCNLWFSELSQGGWGIPATFDASELLSLAWLVESDGTSEVNGDFWIDDVEFIEEDDPATPDGSGNDCSGGSSGAGGAGSGGSNGSNGGSGGKASSGGTSGSGGGASGGSSAGAAGSSAGSTGKASESSGDDDGCSCRAAGAEGRSPSALGFGLLLLGGLARGGRRATRPVQREAVRAAGTCTSPGTSSMRKR